MVYVRQPSVAYTAWLNTRRRHADSRSLVNVKVPHLQVKDDVITPNSEMSEIYIRVCAGNEKSLKIDCSQRKRKRKVAFSSALFFMYKKAHEGTNLYMISLF